jgi:hypothetical protein
MDILKIIPKIKDVEQFLIIKLNKDGVAISQIHINQNNLLSKIMLTGGRHQ